MAAGPDPFRTLGLNPGASLEEIHRAYRRLAKVNHPDAAGEAALPRFLAIQAAYEALVAPTRDRPAARPREPWRADADRARATREGAARRAGRSPRGTASGTGPATAGGTAARGSGRPGAGTRPPSPGEAPRSGTRRDGRRRPPNKATPGSTSYDAAEDEPFEPEWSGGTWYGSSSGTYWTINPKEYADPRKHGPEYQRRARRNADPSDASDAEGDERRGAFASAGTSGIGGDASGRDDGGGPQPGPVWPEHDAPGGPLDDPVAGFGPPAVASLDGFLGGFGGRVAIALVGWPPIGLLIASLAGEATGCSRFAASCVDAFGIGTWLAQLIIIAILVALPALATVSATGTLAALAAAVPAAVFLSATGGSRQPDASAAVLGAVLAIAYLAGVGIGAARRLGVRRVPWRS